MVVCLVLCVILRFVVYRIEVGLFCTYLSCYSINERGVSGKCSKMSVLNYVILALYRKNV